jgi:DNA-binding transcriptional regulator GbsR (MarR family)
MDPSLWDNTTIMVPFPGCTCLSSMYLTLTELQSITAFSFPQTNIPLRKAMGVLSDLIHCPQCPKDTFSAIQNISSIAALCKAIIERFNKVLMAIDAEAERLERNGQKKPYRVAEINPELQNLHTGTHDCPIGFNIEVEPKDWKR